MGLGFGPMTLKPVAKPFGMGLPFEGAAMGLYKPDLVLVPGNFVDVIRHEAVVAEEVGIAHVGGELLSGILLYTCMTDVQLGTVVEYGIEGVVACGGDHFTGFGLFLKYGGDGS